MRPRRRAQEVLRLLLSSFSRSLLLRRLLHSHVARFCCVQGQMDIVADSAEGSHGDQLMLRLLLPLLLLLLLMRLLLPLLLLLRWLLRLLLLLLLLLMVLLLICSLLSPLRLVTRPRGTGDKRRYSVVPVALLWAAILP
jgi:hypothetical protein